MRFGTQFTDHMVIQTWTPGTGWKAAELVPYGPLALSPAAAVFHYGQEILEGLKAHRHADGSIWTFRPWANGERFRRSAYRLAMPELPAADFVAAIDLLVDADRAQVPGGEQESLYLRPFMFASEAFLGVRPATQFTFCVIASPSGAYFGVRGRPRRKHGGGGAKPISLWLSEPYARAAPGGTGDAKCGGNYAASLLAQQEAIQNGCDQVCFRGGGGTVQELGASNIWFVHADGRLVTPELDGSILPGITRDAVRTLAEELGHPVEERPLTVDEWRDGVRSGRITEVFACGTAATVTPIGTLKWPDGGDSGRGGVGSGELTWADRGGPVTERIRRLLLDICSGRTPDSYGWLHQVARAVSPLSSTPVHD